MSVIRRAGIFVLSALLLWGSLLLYGCSNGGGDLTPWPEDMNAVLTTVLVDGTNDQVLLPPEQEGPPYSLPVPFPPVDVNKISLGVDGGFLYMRVDFAGTIPTAPVHIAPSGEVEEQIVKNQGMNISLDVDNNVMTGAEIAGMGIDIFFAIRFDYGMRSLVYSNYDFVGNDIHNNQKSLQGEIGPGGPGFNYVIVRYQVSGLGSFFPLGATVGLQSWSEAESYNLDGTLKYHHFAFDPFPTTNWTIPNP